MTSNGSYDITKPTEMFYKNCEAVKKHSVTRTVIKGTCHLSQTDMMMLFPLELTMFAYRHCFPYHVKTIAKQMIIMAVNGIHA